MQRSPSDLHTSLLTQMVVEAIERNESRDIGVALRMFLTAVRWRVADLYGIDRWPLSSYFKWKRRRYDRRAWSVRGLASSGASSDPANYNAGKT